MESYNTAVLSKKSVIVIASVLVILFFVIVSALYFLSSPSKSTASLPAAPTRNTSATQNENSLRRSTPPQSNVVPAPIFKAEKHILQTAIPIPPKAIKQYALKQNYSEQEVKEFGQRLGLSNIVSSKENSDYFLVSQLQDMNTRGYMQFNKKTGAFLYKSYGEVLPDTNQADTNPIAVGTNYVKKLGLNDGTVSCTNFYSVKGYENSMVTVVCHRDWEKVGGIPILSFPGVINIDENTLLNSTSLGKADANAPEDKRIVATSNGTDGKVQPEDFNSISFTIEKKTGRLLSILSNLRQLDNSQPQPDAVIISPLTALQKIQQNKVELSLVAPAGVGQVNWSSVYPENKAIVRQAVINDFMVVYLEKPFSYTQQALIPYYLIRGTAALDTGYVTKYISLVPALEGKTIVHNTNENRDQGQIAGVETTAVSIKDAGQKQGTFNTTDTTTPVPTIQIDQTAGNACIAGKNQNKDTGISVHIDGLGDVKLVYNGKHQYYIGSSTFPISDKKVIEDAFFDLVAKQYAFSSANYINRNKDNSKLTALVEANTVDSYNQLFDSVYGIYQSPGVNSAKIPPSCESSIYPPNKNCYSQYDNGPGYTYDHTQIGIVRDKVVNTFVSKGVSAVSDLKAGSDIFPRATLTNFSWVFLKLGSQYEYLKGDCYLSGTSPSLFLYPKSQSNMLVSYPESTIYTYPGSTEKQISVIASPNGVITINNASYDYLYYEYNQSVHINIPQQGYSIASEKYSDWIHDTLTPAVGLTANETDRLVTDVTNIMRNVHTAYVKVSLANEDELNTKLPVNISSISRVRRVHLLITPVQTQLELTPQSIQKITRNGSYAVEVGARLVN